MPATSRIGSMLMAQDGARHDPAQRQELPGLLLALPEVAQPLASILTEAAEAGVICVLAATGGSSPRIIAGADAVAVAVTEHRWDAVAHGLPFTLSIALPRGAGPDTALIAYRREPGGFDDSLRSLLRTLAERAAGVLEMVYRMSTVEPSRLLADRNRVDMAVGVLMATHGCDPRQALERLRVIAAEAEISLSVAAERVLGRLGH